MTYFADSVLEFCPPPFGFFGARHVKEWSVNLPANVNLVTLFEPNIFSGRNLFFQVTPGSAFCRFPPV